MSASFCQHIHILCTDIKTMVAFWVDGFGATLDEYRKFGPLDGAILDLNANVKLYLKVAPCTPPDPNTPHSGVEHIGMMTEKLDDALAHLTSLPGVRVTKEPFMSGTLRCAYITGPEGVLVEVMAWQ